MRRRLGLIAVVILGLLATPATSAHADAAAVPGTAVPARAPAPDAGVERALKQAVRTERSEASPGRDGATRLEVPEPTVKQPKAPRDPDTCLKDALASRRADDKRYIVCIGAGGPMPKVPPELLNRAPTAAVDVLPLPQFCQDFGRGRWVFFRTQACAILNRTAFIFFPNGEPAGTLNYVEVNFAYTSSIISAWAQQIQILMTGGTGVGLQPGTTVTGVGVCVNQCTTTRSDFPPQPVSTTTDPAGEAFFDSAATAPGAKAFSFSVFRYTFQNADWLPLTPASAETPRLRCDNALPGSSTPGCVFPDHAPVHQYSRTGLFPELARHIGDAQDSGLPGGPDDAALTRQTDRGSIDANRERACPRSDRGGYPRPATKSCDEYPFASTHQGAASSPPGSARTFSYCQINEPAGTGPTGYSVCMIDAWQNSVGGSDMETTFFRTNRVLEADEFHVWITGTGTGPNPNPPNNPPVVDAGPDVTGFEGEPVELAGSATDDDGPPQVQWSYRPGPDVDPGAECFFGDDATAVTTIRCTDDGTYTVTISASDGIHDDPSTDSATVRLVNVPPQLRRAQFAARAAAADEPTLGIVAPRPWQLFRVGEPVTLTTNFNDPGSNDTQVCDIRWDDGTTSSDAAADGVCGGRHVYAHAGMYTIQPSVTDDDGGVSEQASVMVVVYDPNGDWANADGSYDSAAGALTSQPTAAGEGWFHLTGRYYPQDTTRPAGAARSWLPPTAYRFGTDGSTLDWMVVTQDGKVAAKGSGTLAGHTGRYGFVFYAYDGCAAGGRPGACQPGNDRFRAVVWPLSAGANPGADTVYDNNPGGGYDVDVSAPTSLRTGSVLIQRSN